MAVRPNQSAVRVLEVLEKIARHQPIGITELAKLLNEDKSAVQRALVTLAHTGWICAAPNKPTRWELTAHIHAVAHVAHSTHDLRHRGARVILAAPSNVPDRDLTLAVADDPELKSANPFLEGWYPVNTTCRSGPGSIARRDFSPSNFRTPARISDEGDRAGTI